MIRNKTTLTYKWLVNLCIALSVIALISSSAFAAKSKKPNILFIPVDDLKPLLGCYGYSYVKTPNIDKLAARGTVFLNASCQMAICGPSRASLLTGLYPDETKVWDLATKMRDVNPKVVTIPQFFKQQGYITTGIGKTFDPRCVDNLDKPSWSEPYLKQPTKYPKGKPINNYYRSPKTAKDYKKFTAEMKAKKIPKKEQTSHLDKYPLCKPPVECYDCPDDYYFDGAATAEAEKKLAKLAASKKPFFYSVGYKRPHLPFAAPKKYWDLYERSKIPLTDKPGLISGVPSWVYAPGNELRNYSGISGPNKDYSEARVRELIHGYLACVSYIDALIGRLVKKVNQLGIADNTIICLWGDHGFHLGDHIQWCKHSNFEEAVRSPMIFVAPGQKNPGSKNSSPTELVDIFPTLCELTGYSIPKHLSGKSLKPLMDNPSASVRKAALSQYHRGYGDVVSQGYTLRSERYRYVKWIRLVRSKNQLSGPLLGRELYDLEKDPAETTNFAGNPKYAKLVADFEAMFKERGVAQHTKIEKGCFGLSK